MVSIIKNQLLKHLSRFTKNLSADKINLSTFKGEGELSNLELNEVVLMDLLELPSWLSLKQAWCNKVTFRIPWTKLKSVPICLNLEEVQIVVETCEELRIPSMHLGNTNAGVPGKYSFIHKVIDGITVNVNTVNILFYSPAFSASVQITRIVVDSKNHKFQPSDLRMTRLKNQAKGQILIFKELKWDTVRIEAKSTKDKNLTPLRLIINEARCRIVIKKRLSDSFILGSRLAIILNDLMWFFTDSQLKAGLYFLDSLTDLIQKSTQITRRTKAARKLEELPEYQAQLLQEGLSDVQDKSKLFAAHDVIETSYHLISHQIMLHLSDDPGAGRSSYPNLKNGDALHISLNKFHIDYYPYHLAKGNRKHWLKYNSNFVPHALWQEQALNSFKTRLLNLVDQHRPLHTPLNRPMKNPDSTPQSPESKPQANNEQKNSKKTVELKIAKLMTSCIVLRIEDFTIYKVTSSQKKGLKEFIFGDRSQLSLPVDSNIVHAEFTHYYYPSDVPFPLPPPKFYVQLNPISVMFDIDTCLWINSFGLNLFQSLSNAKNEETISSYSYMDIKIEAILPRINFESAADHPNQKDRPKCLSFQVTRATITNIRSLEQSSRADLAKCVDSFHMGSLFFGSEFPSKPNDFYVVTQKFIDHISTVDNIRNVPSQIDSSVTEDWMSLFSREMLWTDAKDVWCISLDPVWGDFNGARAIGISKSVPFLDALPVTIWLHTHMDPNSTVKPSDNTGEFTQIDADIHALVYITNLVSIQINHYQYLFLLRLAEDAALLATFLALDSERILKVESNSTIAMGVLIPQLEITFVMPSNSPGKESSGGDIESVVPDTSSIADDMYIGSTPSVWKNSTSSITQIGGNKRPIANGSSSCQMDLPTSNSSDYLQTATGKLSQQEQTMLLQQKGNLNLQTNINMGFTSMKKGFTSLMSSIDSALKPSPDDLSDTMSIRSDVSSDSEKFVHINCDLDIAGAEIIFVVFEFSERIEEASEVLEEDNTLTTTSEHSVTSTSRRKDLVSVSTFKLNKIEFVYQSLGFQSSIKIQLSNLLCDDCSCISWDELQSKFGTRSRVWTCNPPSDFSTPKIKLRFDHDLVVIKSDMLGMDLTNRDTFAKLFTDLITINVTDLILNLNMSTVTGLADLIEDEIIPIPFPIEITLDNVKIHLNEDRPPVNITSPGPIPIDLNITNMFITRTEDGVFNLFPSIKAVSSNNDESVKKDLVKVDSITLNNEDMRRLMTFERISEENRLLRKSKEESDKEKDVLREYLKKCQDEVTRLLNEKQNLLDDIRRMQHQWTSSKR
ncbi:bridge-like lipid transfer protein family member 3B [Diorhabda carinulata]|uniref:bridge-like lipid transfer protein family member 3B n=1 Tax=Diorhabda carinulata TaxID=1163345 RepID=UPI0025A009ED|nr:bridge-like lipid transfer protein family member 3B [Diorhabda carinulata]